MKHLVVAATITTLALGNVSAVAATDPEPAAPSDGASYSPEPMGERALRAVSNGTFQWRKCNESFGVPGLQCGRFRVPQDWRNPSTGSFRLRVYRQRAFKEDRPTAQTLFLNPGGPGYPGIAALQVMQAKAHKLRKDFHLVTWDPRGVPSSNPRLVGCPDPTASSLITAPKAAPAVGSFRWQQVSRAYDSLLSAPHAYCQNNSLPLGTKIGTNNVVRDLEAMRRAVGDPLLNYYGYSYGTTIGRVYALQYPTLVGRIVLDGVTNPNPRVKDYATRNTVAGKKGFKYTYRSFSEDTRRAYRQLNNFLQASTLTVGSQTVSRYDVWSVVNQAARNEPAQQNIAGTICALAAAAGLQPCSQVQAQSQKQALAALEAARRKGPSFNTLTYLINCVDLKNRPRWQWVGRTAARKAGTTKKADQVGGINGVPFGQMCRGMSGPADPIPALTKNRWTRNPILVLNGKGDIATPYVGAKETSRRFQGAKLITVDTSFHGLFPAAGKCVNKPVLKYLRKGRMPSSNLRCSWR